MRYETGLLRAESVWSPHRASRFSTPPRDERSKNSAEIPKDLGDREVRGSSPAHAHRGRARPSVLEHPRMRRWGVAGKTRRADRRKARLVRSRSEESESSRPVFSFELDGPSSLNELLPGHAIRQTSEPVSARRRLARARAEGSWDTTAERSGQSTLDRLSKALSRRNRRTRRRQSRRRRRP